MDQSFRYTVEIDEEGFPQFDGLRVDDQPFVHDLLSKIRRFDPNNLASALVTECEGEICLLESFESPLVAQSVESVDAQSSLWVFPGNIKHVVRHDHLYVDEWSRVRTQIGNEKINATLSRKAQARFGELLPESFLSKPLPQWYQAQEVQRAQPLAQHKLNSTEFWESLYQEKRDGWEMREASPVLTHHFSEFGSKFKFDNGKILVPGAGRGHDAHWLSLNTGAKVVAMDFAESAHRDFEALYPNSKVEFMCDDVFRYLTQQKNSLDGVFEHTFFCAIDPTRRREYFSRVWDALKPQGVFFGIFWMRSSRIGPPFGLTQWELREFSRTCGLANSGFEIFSWKRSLHSWPSRFAQEYWVVLKK